MAPSNTKLISLNKSPVFVAQMARKAAHKAARAKILVAAVAAGNIVALEVSASQQAEKKTPAEKKPASIRCRPKPCIFHKADKKAVYNPDPTMFKSATPAQQGYDLVRPSKGMKAYKMTETVQTATRRNKTITRTAQPPRFMIAPRQENLSAVRKPEVLEDIMRREAEERQRLEEINELF